MQVTAVKFTPSEQDDQRLKELGLKDTELSRDEQALFNKKKAIALIRLEQTKKFQTINNEEAWLKKTIESITDEFIKLQDQIEEAKPLIDEIDIKDYGKRLMDEYGDIVGIKDYKLYYVFTDKLITENALETFRILEGL